MLTAFIVGGNKYLQISIIFIFLMHEIIVGINHDESQRPKQPYVRVVYTGASIHNDQFTPPTVISAQYFMLA